VTDLRQPAIDACVHHRWSGQAEIMEYMGKGWREFLGEPDSLPGGAGAIPVLPGWPYPRPAGDRLANEASAGTSYEDLRRDVLDGGLVDRVIVSHDLTMLTSALPNTHLARELARAANDWTIDRWLDADPRVHGLVLLPNQVSEHAVAELERVGSHPKMVGVLLGANGLGKPFGHPAYDPIYDAAAALELPVVIHTGGEAVAETLTHPTAGGLPTSFGEYQALNAQPMATHLVTLVGQGVFEKFPGLQVFLVGTGAAWLPSVVWRFDTDYMAYRREAPWVKRFPSEYVREHVRISTWPLERAPTPEQLAKLLNAFDGMEDMLVYASGYPSWDTNGPEEAASRVPAGWHAKVFRSNALDLFRWGTDSGHGRADSAPVEARL
jgi:predicted TIM-barrel fold metal-dependent hydrolase